MNNTDKLLRAFIEAIGYEIKEVTVDKEIPDLSRPERSTITIKEVIDYKVTKKPYDPAKFPFDTDDGKIKHSLGGFGPVSIRIL